MGSAKDFLAVIRRTDADIMTLDGFKKALPDVPTPTLVSGYIEAATFAKRVTGFVDAMKKELVDNVTETGRFLDKDNEDLVRVDPVKGHRYIETADGSKELQAQRRVSVKLDAERAELHLKLLGLYDRAVDKIHSVSDVEQLYKRLAEIAEEHPDYEGLQDLLSMFTEKKVLSEEKVGALVALDEIEPEDLEEFVSENVTYALVLPKKTKKH